jgi:hypothetical protein
MNILPGDFKAKLRREDTVEPTTGNETLLETAMIVVFE